ncbi:hypothetical protein [Rhodothermus marinus]|uniref:hypothetical protein n=1 Tax=Rhodothermus marinus TaxID=29549 RepID=UPI000AB00AD7|nr:hypothetical protein [Rhodothermus marinus]
MPTDKFCRVRLVERINFTDDLALFRFQPEEPVSFTPGQYATLALEVEGKLVPRPIRSSRRPTSRCWSSSSNWSRTGS